MWKPKSTSAMSTYITYPVNILGLTKGCWFRSCSRVRDRLHGQMLQDTFGPIPVEVRVFQTFGEAQKQLEWLRLAEAVLSRSQRIVRENVKVATSGVSRVEGVHQLFLTTPRHKHIKKETPVLVQVVPKVKKIHDRTFHLCDHYGRRDDDRRLQALPAILCEFLKDLENESGLGGQTLKIFSLTTVQAGGKYYVKALELCEHCRLSPTAPFENGSVARQGPEH